MRRTALNPSPYKRHGGGENPCTSRLMRPARNSAARPDPEIWVLLGLFAVVLAGGVTVAYHNFRLGRGDRAGAMRLAIFAFSVTVLTWLLAAQHVQRPWEVLLIIREISWALFVAAALWCIYMAIEPYVRRHWPESLISWTRFQQGRMRNPLVASHMLAGVALAVSCWAGHLVLRNLTSIIERQYGAWFLDTASIATGYVIFHLTNALYFTMGTLLLLVLSRLVLRRLWIGDVVFILLLTASGFQAYSYLHQTIILGLWETRTVVAYLWMFRRCGLLSFAVFFFVLPIMRFPPVDWSTWYFGRALMIPLIPLAMAAWALWVILPAQKGPPGSDSAP
jgi:hypothetical protein